MTENLTSNYARSQNVASVASPGCIAQLVAKETGRCSPSSANRFSTEHARAPSLNEFINWVTSRDSRASCSVFVEVCSKVSFSKKFIFGGLEVSRFFATRALRRMCERSKNFPPNSRQLVTIWLWSNHLYTLQSHHWRCSETNPKNIKQPYFGIIFESTFQRPVFDASMTFQDTTLPRRVQDVFRTFQPKLGRLV